MGKLEAILGSLLLCFLAFSGLETKTEHGMLARINACFSLKTWFANTHSFILQFQNSCLVLSQRKLRDFEFFVSIWIATFIVLESNANKFGPFSNTEICYLDSNRLGGSLPSKALGSLRLLRKSGLYQRMRKMTKPRQTDYHSQFNHT
jgi:hypothetical protein